MNAVRRVAQRIEPRLVTGNGLAVGSLTARARPAKELFARVAAALIEHGIEPVQEKIYGRAGARSEILALREAAFAAVGLDPALPCSYHQGLPVEGGDLAGVQLWGVVPGDPETTVEDAGRGRLWQGRDYRILCLPGIAGTGPGGTEEAHAMFRAAERELGREGFDFTSVARTWIYLARILEWYGEFNRVRRTFFAERGIGAGEERAYPASTGIQGTTAGEECSMDLLAVEGPGAVRTPIHATSRQEPAFLYGSAFSRGMSLEAGGLELVFVSGTASIDRSGATVHRGDPAAQIEETLLCVEAVLAARGRSLDDVGLATLFCKTPEVLRAYREVAPRFGDLPVVPVLADVCRPELLVEIEAFAVVPAHEEGIS